FLDFLDEGFYGVDSSRHTRSRHSVQCLDLRADDGRLRLVRACEITSDASAFDQGLQRLLQNVAGTLRFHETIERERHYHFVFTRVRRLAHFNLPCEDDRCSVCGSMLTESPALRPAEYADQSVLSRPRPPLLPIPPRRPLRAAFSRSSASFFASSGFSS